MGFWNRLFSGQKSFFEGSSPNMVCELTLCGEQYILNEFDIKLERGNEYFSAYAVFSEDISSRVEIWITNSTRKESGVVKFYKNIDSMTEGSLFEILFYDASCISFKSHTSSREPIKTVVMTLPRLKIAGEEF